jgi:hypothetical protein
LQHINSQQQTQQENNRDRERGEGEEGKSEKAIGGMRLTTTATSLSKTDFKRGNGRGRSS